MGCFRINTLRSASRSARGPRRLRLETMEDKQLMAADLAALGNVSPAVATEHVPTAVASQVIVETTRPEVVAQRIDVWEHARLAVPQQAAAMPVVRVADQAFAFYGVQQQGRISQSTLPSAQQQSSSSQSTLTSASWQRHEQAIWQALEDLEDRLAVHWQLPEGEGPRVG